jgi:hypothetical protein
LAHRERGKAAGPFDQHGVAEALRVRRLYFGGEIETRIKAFDDLAA